MLVVPRANGLRLRCCRAERERVGEVDNKGCATREIAEKPQDQKGFGLNHFCGHEGTSFSDKFRQQANDGFRQKGPG